MDVTLTADDLTAWFTSRDLPAPYIPPALAGKLERIDERTFATRSVDVHPIWIPGWLDELRGGPVEDFAVVAHAGHGGSKVAVHVFVAIGPVAVFLQLPWGTAFGDVERQRQGMKWAMEKAEPVIRAAEARAGEPRRWALVISGYETSGWQALPDGEWHDSDEPYVETLLAEMG